MADDDERVHRVDMVRIERDEEYFDREEVLGRDVTSVFPKEYVPSALDPEAAKAAIGALKFISETELAEIKSTRGGRVEDGAVASDKPLAVILAEAKEAKEAAFQATWKQMKTGKNRPLDEDELEFLDTLADARAREEAEQRRAEEAELSAFQEAIRQAAVVPATTSKPAGPAPKPSAELKVDTTKPAPAPKKLLAKPLLRVKPVPAASRKPNADQEPPDKKRRVEEAGPEDAIGNADLAGLLGDYGSSSDSD